MSAPRYNVNVSGDALPAVLALLATMPGETYTHKAAPARAARTAQYDVFEPDTGDAKLDAFMRRSRAKNGAPKPRPKPKPPAYPFGLRMATQAQWREIRMFEETAKRMWRERGYVVEGAGENVRVYKAQEVAV